MPLTYTKETTQTSSETVELSAPKSWGMFSPAGNKSLQTKAETLMKDLEKADGLTKKVKAFAKFFRAWRRMGYTATMGEASDTVVRETVWCFALKAGKCVDVSYDTIDDIWESKEAYPARKSA